MASESGVGSGGGLCLAASLDYDTMQHARLDVPLRGIFAGEVVRIFMGTNADIHKSSIRDTLDAFFSHSWRGSWWQKCIATVFYSYFPIATLLALVVQLLLGVLMIPGTPVSEKPVCMPFMSNHLAEVAFCRPPGHMYLYCLSALGCLFAHRLIPARVGKQFFLDKGCIDQSDPTSIAKGVSSLGGILRHCSAFVVLWTDDYFTRLWCIFELACFMRFGGHEGALQAILIPVILPTFIVCGNLYILSVWTICDICLVTGFVEWVSDCIGLLPATFLIALVAASPLFLGFLYVAHSLARLREDLVSQMSSFQTETADVARPGDRMQIEECIRCWYGEVAKFDEFVQGPLLDMLRVQNGSRVLVPYWGMIAFSFPSLLRALEYALLANWNAALWPLGYVTAINPIFMLVTQWCLQVQVMPKTMMLIVWASLILLWGAWAYFVFSVPASVAAVVFVVLFVFVFHAYQPQARELYFLGFARFPLPPRFGFSELELPQSQQGYTSIS